MKYLLIETRFGGLVTYPLDDIENIQVGKLIEFYTKREILDNECKVNDPCVKITMKSTPSHEIIYTRPKLSFSNKSDRELKWEKIIRENEKE